MDIDDLNIYDDLDDFHEEEVKKNKEVEALENKLAESETLIASLRQEIKNYNKEKKQYEANFQLLLDTARAEINRKNNQINELRKELDDLVFRRKGVSNHQNPTRRNNSHQQPFMNDKNDKKFKPEQQMPSSKSNAATTSTVTSASYYKQVDKKQSPHHSSNRYDDKERAALESRDPRRRKFESFDTEQQETKKFKPHETRQDSKDKHNKSSKTIDLPNIKNKPESSKQDAVVKNSSRSNAEPHCDRNGINKSDSGGAAARVASPIEILDTDSKIQSSMPSVNKNSNMIVNDMPNKAELRNTRSNFSAFDVIPNFLSSIKKLKNQNSTINVAGTNDTSLKIDGIDVKHTDEKILTAHKLNSKVDDNQKLKENNNQSTAQIENVDLVRAIDVSEEEVKKCIEIIAKEFLPTVEKSNSSTNNEKVDLNTNEECVTEMQRDDILVSEKKENKVVLEKVEKMVVIEQNLKTQEVDTTLSENKIPEQMENVNDLNVKVPEDLNENSDKQEIDDVAKHSLIIPLISMDVEIDKKEELPNMEQCTSTTFHEPKSDIKHDFQIKEPIIIMQKLKINILDDPILVSKTDITQKHRTEDKDDHCEVPKEVLNSEIKKRKFVTLERENGGDSFTSKMEKKKNSDVRENESTGREERRSSKAIPTKEDAKSNLGNNTKAMKDVPHTKSIKETKAKLKEVEKKKPTTDNSSASVASKNKLKTGNQQPKTLNFMNANSLRNFKIPKIKKDKTVEVCQKSKAAVKVKIQSNAQMKTEETLNKNAKLLLPKTVVDDSTNKSFGSSKKPMKESETSLESRQTLKRKHSGESHETFDCDTLENSTAKMRKLLNEIIQTKKEILPKDKGETPKDNTTQNEITIMDKETSNPTAELNSKPTKLSTNILKVTETLKKMPTNEELNVVETLLEMKTGTISDLPQKSSGNVPTITSPSSTSVVEKQASTPPDSNLTIEINETSISENEAAPSKTENVAQILDENCNEADSHIKSSYEFPLPTESPQATNNALSTVELDSRQNISTSEDCAEQASILKFDLSDSAEYQEIDSKMKRLFESPPMPSRQHSFLSNTTINDHATSVRDLSADLTIEETFVKETTNVDNNITAINESQTSLDDSLNDSNSRKILKSFTMGKTDYRLEIDEMGTHKFYINRHRKKKKKTSAAISVSASASASATST